MQEKVCNKCHISKPLTEYTKSKTCKFGVRNTCKDCRRIERQEYQSKPEVKAASQKYYQEHKEEFRERMREHYHSLNGQYHQYKKRAVKSNIEFELTQEDCVPYYNTTCSYCGGPIKGLGIDRLSSKLGYVKDNITPCCSTCNFMKGTLEKEDFIAQVLKIFKFNDKKYNI